MKNGIKNLEFSRRCFDGQLEHILGSDGYELSLTKRQRDVGLAIHNTVKSQDWPKLDLLHSNSSGNGKVFLPFTKKERVGFLFSKTAWPDVHEALTGQGFVLKEVPRWYADWYK
jgi:hypothetical protein